MDELASVLLSWVWFHPVTAVPAAIVGLVVYYFLDGVKEHIRLQGWQPMLVRVGLCVAVTVLFAIFIVDTPVNLLRVAVVTFLWSALSPPLFNGLVAVVRTLVSIIWQRMGKRGS